MSEHAQKVIKVGGIISADLTIPNTEQVLDFYQQIIGWQSEGLAMEDEQGKYDDYVVKDVEGNWVGGICHRRGMNQDLPPVWMVYINVADIQASVQRCEELGGKVLKVASGDDGAIYYAIIQDPAGAIMGLSKAS